MGKIESSFKTEVKKLSKEELEKLVIKAASMSKQFHDFLMVNYIDKAEGEKLLFEQAKNDLKNLIFKSYKGFSYELVIANMLAACNKRINEFAKVCKNKYYEMELLMYVLKIPFSIPYEHFETCFTRYNHQVYLLLRKSITLLQKKLHEDYYIEYAPKLNEYLKIFKKYSDHLDYVYDMPDSI